MKKAGDENDISMEERRERGGGEKEVFTGG